MLNAVAVSTYDLVFWFNFLNVFNAMYSKMETEERDKCLVSTWNNKLNCLLRK